MPRFTVESVVIVLKTIMKGDKKMELVRKTHKFTDKKGKEKVGTNFYIVENGNWVSIKPSFPQDYFKLKLISTLKEDE